MNKFTRQIIALLLTAMPFSVSMACDELSGNDPSLQAQNSTPVFPENAINRIFSLLPNTDINNVDQGQVVRKNEIFY